MRERCSSADKGSHRMGPRPVRSALAQLRHCNVFAVILSSAFGCGSEERKCEECAPTVVATLPFDSSGVMLPSSSPDVPRLIQSRRDTPSGPREVCFAHKSDGTLVTLELPWDECDPFCPTYLSAIQIDVNESSGQFAILLSISQDPPAPWLGVAIYDPSGLLVSTFIVEDFSSLVDASSSLISWIGDRVSVVYFRAVVDANSTAILATDVFTTDGDRVDSRELAEIPFTGPLRTSASFVRRKSSPSSLVAQMDTQEPIMEYEIVDGLPLTEGTPIVDGTADALLAAVATPQGTGVLTCRGLGTPDTSLVVWHHPDLVSYIPVTCDNVLSYYGASGGGTLMRGDDLLIAFRQNFGTDEFREYQHGVRLVTPLGSVRDSSCWLTRWPSIRVVDGSIFAEWTSTGEVISMPVCM